MKQYLKHLIGGLVLALGLCGTANAILVIPPGTINWAGECLDCNGPQGAPSMAHALLGVNEFANIHAGSATDIGGMNLTSFEYRSNLFPFGLRASDIVMAMGEISTASRTVANVMIRFHAEIGYPQGGFGAVSESIWTFFSDIEGRWELLEGEHNYDFGVASTFNVPEPAAVLLMVLGFASLYLRKRVRA